MASTLIETININADDFTDNFLTCPTCMSAYDEHEHTPKLLSCSHTLCRSCLERIASISSISSTSTANATATTNGNGTTTLATNSPSLLIRNTNSISRSIAAADAAAAAINANSISSASATTSGNQTVRPSSSLQTSSTNGQMIELTFRCPICREMITLPRGGVINLPPSFIINQLLDLVKNQRRDIVPRCKNHINEELLFCETCDAAFCSLCESHCKVASNADHIVIPFSIAIKRMTEIYFFKSNQCINSFNLALANVQREIDNLNTTVENVVEQVDTSINDLKRIIEKRRDDLIKNLCRIKDSKIKVLNEQINLIQNEKQKVEMQCKEYHQANIECKLLGSQIQTINEKLDCLRTLCEPRENSFISYEFKFNDVDKQIENSVRTFGRFKISSTYPPLCTARLLDNVYSLSSYLNSLSSNTNGFNGNVRLSQQSSLLSSYPSTNTNYAVNLAIYVQIDTVDYYGQKRTEGGDPVNVIITDPCARQQSIESPSAIIDLKNGSYLLKFVPNCVGKYRIDVNIFSRPIYQMPMFLNVVEHVSALWTFGATHSSSSSSLSSNGSSGSFNTTNLNAFLNKSNNKGNTERDFNMPISIRCYKQFVYVLDSGNNRIKVLNLQGQFVRHIQHDGLNESSSTALILCPFNSRINLISLNWRLKLISNYELVFDQSDQFTNEFKLSNYELNEGYDQPIGLMETFHPQIYLIQDKKKLNLCTNTGTLMYQSLETKMRNECNIKNLTAFCGSSSSRRTIFVVDSSATSSSSIYEIDLDWLCDYKLDSLIDSFKLEKLVKLDERSYSSSSKRISSSSSLSQDGSEMMNGTSRSTNERFTFRKFTTSQMPLSNSSLSLNSTLSSNSSCTISTNSSAVNNSNTKGTYTALCYDSYSTKLLAAKTDKQNKTVIEIYNTDTYCYEYSLETNPNEKPLKRVTSMSCTNDGRVLCCDLIQNVVKMFKFV